MRSKVAVLTASRVAHNPYRTNIYKKPLLAPKITFKTQIISKVINIKNKIIKIFIAWKKPTANRTIRRIVKRVSSIRARNKDDPHLEKRV